MSNQKESHNQEKRLNLCGIHFRRIRLEQNMTLADIQATLEIDYGIVLDRTNLGRIENGERTVTDIEIAVFAHMFGVSVTHLLWGKENPSTAEVGEALKKVKVRYATRRPSQSKNT